MIPTYIVLEIQADEEGHASILPAIVKQELLGAESEYHRILSAAAISNVYCHTALIMTQDGTVLYSQSYRHIPVVSES